MDIARTWQRDLKNAKIGIGHSPPSPCNIQSWEADMPQIDRGHLHQTVARILLFPK